MHGGFSSAVVVDSRHLNIPYVQYTCTSSCENTYGFTPVQPNNACEE